ncbi:hypothetical protein [Haliangium sp.]|uniref:hypothetical protein n=1 Tax=Haliangium sp. TaxID=2663208 RepID=UPI003D0FAB4B
MAKSKLERRAYAAGHFLVTLDSGGATGNWDTSWLHSVDGGTIKSAILNEAGGKQEVPFKTRGPLEIESLTIEAGLGASESILDWIEDAWHKRPSYRNGAITYADFHYRGLLEQTFTEALIEEITFPALDGGNSGPAYLTLKIKPTRIETKDGDGQVLFDQGYDSNKQKAWTPSHFRFSIDGIDCDYVSKIDSFTVKQKIKELPVGGSRYPEIVPVEIEFPDRLTVTMSAAGAGDFIKWHQEDVVADVANAGTSGKTGVIEYLETATASAKPLFSVELDQVGIIGLRFDKSEAGSESIKRCTAELYFENMKFVRGT